MKPPRVTIADPETSGDPGSRVAPWSFALALLLLAGGCSPAVPEREDTFAHVVPEPVAVDHHVHLLSPQLVADWKSLGVPFSRQDEEYSSVEAILAPSAGDGDVETAEGVASAVLLPMAHLYGQAEFRRALDLSESEELESVRYENDHVATEAVRHPTRAVAFCGVDFLRPYAWTEIRRCRRELGVRGLKLHLASAGADLRSFEHLGALARIAAWAETEGTTLMLHFDPQQRGLEVADVEHFIRVVLQPHPDLHVVIPHLGGSGGYGPWTRDVFATFVTWLEAEAERGVPRPGILFDVSGTWLEEESEGVPASTPADAEALRRDLRRVGTERLVFGSDYPVFDPNRAAGLLRAVLQPSPEEWERFMARRLPMLEQNRP